MAARAGARSNGSAMESRGGVGSRPASPPRPGRRWPALGPGVGAAAGVAAAVGPGRWGKGGYGLSCRLRGVRSDPAGLRLGGLLQLSGPRCRRRGRAGEAAGAGLSEKAPTRVGRESPGSGGSPARRRACRPATWRRRLGPEGPSARYSAQGRRGARAAHSGLTFFLQERDPGLVLLPASHSAPLALRFCNGGEVCVAPVLR